VAVSRQSLISPYFMSSSRLPNYLGTHRKRLSLTQEEVAFLLGFRGLSRGARVCKDETLAREPKLRIALAYEAIYQRSIRELFAGVYERVKQEVAKRAKLLTFRKDRGNSQQAAQRRKVLADLASRQSEQSTCAAQI